MLHTRDLFIAFHHTVVDADGVGVGTEEGEHVLHLDMTAESHHLVANGMLESQNHTHGDDHHRQQSLPGYAEARKDKRDVQRHKAVGKDVELK